MTRPRAGSVPDHVAACRPLRLGLGKLGGQEMSYHSDLDLILVYEGDRASVVQLVEMFHLQ